MTADSVMNCALSFVTSGCSDRPLKTRTTALLASPAGLARRTFDRDRKSGPASQRPYLGDRLFLEPLFAGRKFIFGEASDHPLTNVALSRYRMEQRAPFRLVSGTPCWLLASLILKIRTKLLKIINHTTSKVLICIIHSTIRTGIGN